MAWPPRPTSEKGWTRWTDRWGVLTLVVTVALTQMLLVRFGSLSPWKGGGFGMFAAVDSPGMRIISVEGVDDEGQRFVIDVTSTLDSGTRRRLRSFPDTAGLRRLGRELRDEEFVPVGVRRAEVLSILRNENPNYDFRLRSPSGIERAIYRPRTDSDPTLASDDSTKRFRKLILAFWTVTFDEEGEALECNRMSPDVIVDRVPPK